MAVSLALGLVARPGREGVLNIDDCIIVTFFIFFFLTKSPQAGPPKTTQRIFDLELEKMKIVRMGASKEFKGWL